MRDEIWGIRVLGDAICPFAYAGEQSSRVFSLGVSAGAAVDSSITIFSILEAPKLMVELGKYRKLPTDIHTGFLSPEKKDDKGVTESD